MTSKDVSTAHAGVSREALSIFWHESSSTFILRYVTDAISTEISCIGPICFRIQFSMQTPVDLCLMTLNISLFC